MIDFHAHVLPKADHGSRRLETSIKQLAQAKEIGIHTIVATPHFYFQHDTIEEFLLRRDITYQQISEANTTGIRLVKAAEVTLASELPEMPRLEELCVENTRYILLELPNSSGASWIYDAIYKIESNRGLKPIIAHLDRYSEHVQKELLDMDLLIQINAEAFEPFFKRKKYVKLFRSGCAHLLGSDVHGSDGKHYQAFSKACKLLKEEIPEIRNKANLLLG